MNTLLPPIIERTESYLASLPKKARKSIGQFFTSRETAAFMVSLFRVPSDLSQAMILDAGAGTGILSAALVERLQEYQATINSIHLVCYENDAQIIGLLQENLEFLTKQSAIPLSYELRNQNYITSQRADYGKMLFSSAKQEKFDFVIGNPPYLKIGKVAPEALSMPDLCYGAPNLYFLFAGMGLFNLKDDAEMVYIMPRSWTSGAYFTKFRKKFLSDGKLTHIHIFDSRNDVFDHEDVLQETMIVRVKKTPIAPESVTITSTHGNHDFHDIHFYQAPYRAVVTGKDDYVLILSNDTDKETVAQLSHFNYTLPDIGLKMRTGLTVDFRCRELLSDNKTDDTVPLFYSQHIKNGKVVFPVSKQGEYIKTTQNSLLQKNTNLLFVKRFTSKEEHRRLQPAVYLSSEFKEYSKISTQNKINFICGEKDLSTEQVFGLYVLFNSTLYDNYYRILNGSTQVNSTEINRIPIPELSIIEQMGKDLLAMHNMTETACNHVMEKYL